MSKNSTSDVKTKSFTKGWVTDPDAIFLPDSSWSHSRNLTNNNDDGGLGVVKNEPANLHCATFTYTVIGTIHIYKDYWAIFQTDNTNSEIGLFKESTCEYHTIVNDSCLNFNKYHLVIGRARENFDCSFSLYWGDGRNPDRTMNIGDIREAPYEQPWPGVPYNCEVQNNGTCQVCIPDHNLGLDCQQLRLNRPTKIPCLRISKGDNIGQLPNGSYFVAIAYTENGQRVTDYVSLSNTFSVFNHNNVQGSIRVELEGLDTELYDEFELVIVSTINQQTTARRYGLFNTTQTGVFIDFISPTLIAVDLSLIPIRTPIYEKSTGIYQVNNYLLRTSPTGYFQFNYQPLANQIRTNWVMVEQPIDYYREGGEEVGYMRDEQYSYFIRWIYDTGQKSASFHIPGRGKEIGREVTANLQDITQGGSDNIDSASPSPIWKVTNTAYTTELNLPGINDDVIPGNIIARGKMGYWESEELYPSDKPLIYNSSEHTWSQTGDPQHDLCGRPIRHHKMPAEIIDQDGNGQLTRVRVTSDNVPKAIRILGVEFENIRPPVDNDGNLIPGIVGYEILRGSRHGNKSIITKGIINNTRRYISPAPNNPEIRFVNYPFNKNVNSPVDSTLVTPFTTPAPVFYPNSMFVDRNVFSYHSFDTNFDNPFLNISELRVYSEVGGARCVEGQFSEVPDHPKHKLITDFGLTLAWASSIGFAAKSVAGEQMRKRLSPRSMNIGFNAPAISGVSFGALTGASDINVVNTADPNGFVGLTFADLMLQLFSGFSPQTSVVDGIVDTWQSTVPGGKMSRGTEHETQYSDLDYYGTINRAIVSTIMFGFYFNQGVDVMKEAILNLSKFEQYAHRSISLGKIYRNYQGNAIIGNRRRRVRDIRYITNTYTHFGGLSVNNLYRPRTVLLETTQDLTSPFVVDNVPTSIIEVIGCQDFPRNKVIPFTRNTASYYVGLKVPMSRQYGQLDRIVQVVASCRVLVNGGDPNMVNLPFPTSPVIFGGDIYIGKYSEKNTFFYFTDWLQNKPDGFEYDYTLRFLPGRVNFWANFIDFSTGDILSGFIGGTNDELNSSTFNVPFANRFHNLDRCTLGSALGNIFSGNNQGWNTIKSLITNIRFVVRNAAFYLFNSSIREFFLETEYNIDHRDWGDRPEQRHYDEREYGDLEEIFNPAIIKFGNYMKYDISTAVSKTVLNLNSFGNIYPRYYDPYVAENCYQQFPYRLLYSLPQQKLAVKDQWRTYLVNNYKDFSSKPTSVARYSKSGAVILLEAESPIIFQGVEELSTNANTKITIGDGSLFDKAQQNLSASDLQYQYGSCNSRLSFISTPVGVFYMSTALGKIYRIGEGLKEISAINNRWWFNRHLPLKILEDFPDYPHIDNPVAGVGCQSIYNQGDKTIYFCKKDYKLREEFQGQVTYDDRTDKFIYLGSQFELGHEMLFEDCSWTVSYEPQEEYWLSPHDWHPNLNIPGRMNFLTIVDNQAWRHNVRRDLYCNFYGVDYPFEVEQFYGTGQTIFTLRSLEYILEAYVYDDNNKHHLLDDNFDEVIIHNTEQVSGVLNLVLQPKNNPFLSLQYPIINPDSIDVIYSKEEQKYRINQFWDITRDRGEFTGVQQPIWTTFCNGYVKELNFANLDYSKDPLQRKKFRHYGHYVLFRKNVSNNVEFSLKLSNTKLLYSPR